MGGVKHVAVRVYFYILFILFVCSGGLSLIVLAPLYKHAFAPRAAYRQFTFPVIWRHMYKMIWRSLTDKSYNDMFSGRIYDPPILHNNLDAVRIRASWTGAAADCDKCEHSCCAQIGCPMLSDGRCLSFGSLFFGYFYCGRHPENQAQINRYNCPKWEVKNAS